MATPAEGLSVVIFEDSRDSVYREFAQEAAERAGWEHQTFDRPYPATDAITQETDAVITALGIQGSVFTDHPATPIFDRTDTLLIPRAIYSGHPWASDLVRSAFPDILIPKTEPELIVERLSAWLLMLTKALNEG